MDVYLGEARAKALELKAILAPFCERIEIGGSIRREREFVKDIDIVAIPSNRNQLALKLFELAQVGCKKEARQIKFTYRNMKTELWLPQPHDWGRMLAIRTGSADFSKRLATMWVKKGFHGCDQGLTNADGDIMVFDTEHSFFGFLGMRWVEPKNRN